MKLKIKANSGFTLIELLIVIVIISILMALLFVSFTTIQRNSRDTQRKGDLQAVAGILERFYGDNSQYPSSNAGLIRYDNSATSCTSSPSIDATWGSGDIVCNGKNYTRQLSKDPIGTNEYCYVTLNSNQKYEIYADLEGKGNLTSSVDCGGSTGTPYNYRITSND